jgi:hypothetical protein
VVLVEAVCEPFEGVANANLEGAQALGVALQGYLYRRRIIEEVVEEGPPDLSDVVCIYLTQSKHRAFRAIRFA